MVSSDRAPSSFSAGANQSGKTRFAAAGGIRESDVRIRATTGLGRRWRFGEGAQSDLGFEDAPVSVAAPDVVQLNAPPVLGGRVAQGLDYLGGAAAVGGESGVEDEFGGQRAAALAEAADEAKDGHVLVVRAGCGVSETEQAGEEGRPSSRASGIARTGRSTPQSLRASREGSTTCAGSVRNSVCRDGGVRQGRRVRPAGSGASRICRPCCSGSLGGNGRKEPPYPSA